MADKRCQIMELPGLSRNPKRPEVICQRTRKLRMTVRRRKNYLLNWFDEARGKKATRGDLDKMKRATLTLNSGDLVRVKSRQEIRRTLDRWDRLKGCGMMQDMWAYCGTEQRVLKPIRQFLDERDYLMKKCSGLVTLEGAICNGVRDLGPCDRCCYYFWRAEWLEKVE